MTRKSNALLGYYIMFGPLMTVYMQPTTFCNLNCSYCYLPASDRQSRKKMSDDVLEAAVEKVFASPFLTDSHLRIVWHDGEPLSAGLPFYKKAVEAFRAKKPANLTIQHVIQTNGTLITEAWADFFRQERFDVGVSIDGPIHIHNNQRVDRQGEGSFDRTMRGISILADRKVGFSTIAVLSRYSLNHPDEIYDFFYNLGSKSIAFNVEEKEGFNTQSSLDDQDEKEVSELSRKFITQIAKRAKKDGCIEKFRELHIPLKKLLLLHKGLDRFGSELSEPFKMVSISYKGDISTYSPELLPVKHGVYGDFIFGNVLTDDIGEDICLSEKFKKVYDAIEAGKTKCRLECEFYGICTGGEPSNKLFENGDFNTSETRHCRINVKERFSAIGAIMEEELGYEEIS